MLKKLSLLLIAGLLFLSCTAEQTDEVLYLKTDNSYHPIYVRGNPDAETYIMWVHGGPGSSGLYYGDIEEVGVLHDNYRVIYWDQLSSGGTVGNPSSDDFKVDEFASHLDGVTKIIKNRYNPKQIYLLGHSWGGFLSASYLIAGGDESLSEERQSYYNGFINLNAIMDVQDTLTNGVTYVKDFARKSIDDKVDVKKWEKTLKWYNERNGVFRGQDVTTHYEYIDDAGGMVVQKERRDQVTSELTIKMVFGSPFEFYSYYDNQRAIRTYLDIEDASLVRENEPNIRAITIPTLLMAGEDDKIAFMKDTERWHRMLLESAPNVSKANPENFPLIKYNNAAHAIFLDAKDKYVQDIHDFINKHNRH